MTDPETAAARARADVGADRLWKARDRLSAAVRDSPTDQEILELLGEVHFRMGDGPAAWRYWALTERRGADVEAAERAFDERYGRSGLAEQLSQIPVRAPIKDYPSGARGRLLVLEERARAENVRWPRVRSAGQEERHDDEELEGGCLGATVIGALLVGPWLFGLVAVLYLVGRFVLGVV